MNGDRNVPSPLPRATLMPPPPPPVRTRSTVPSPSTSPVCTTKGSKPSVGRCWTNDRLVADAGCAVTAGATSVAKTIADVRTRFAYLLERIDPSC
jgi:hypothetical protein